MSDILFSILVVALNPGEKLEATIGSILCQDYKGYEILVKDGMSSDGSIEKIQEKYGLRKSGLREFVSQENRLRLLRCSDRSIYDAMNQAAESARGDYVLFLNCGDLFYDEHVLRHAAEMIQKKKSEKPCIFYGNTFHGQAKAVVHSAPEITGFTCYRNIPCHQSCFYDRRLFGEKKYDLEYRIRADYDHFLWCYYRRGAEMVYMDMVVSSYEGGGYSEDRKNRARDRAEHRKITAEYMSRGELAKYRFLMAVSLAPLRSWMAENPIFSGIYHHFKSWIYGVKV